MDIRKTVVIKETIEADGVGEACDPITRVVAVAVIQNPFAGRFVKDLSPLFNIGGQFGERLMADAVKLLAGPPVNPRKRKWRGRLPVRRKPRHFRLRGSTGRSRQGRTCRRCAKSRSGGDAG